MWAHKPTDMLQENRNYLVTNNKSRRTPEVMSLMTPIRLAPIAAETKRAMQQTDDPVVHHRFDLRSDSEAICIILLARVLIPPVLNRQTYLRKLSRPE